MDTKTNTNEPVDEGTTLNENTDATQEVVDTDVNEAAAASENTNATLYEKVATMQHLLMKRRMVGARGGHGGPAVDPMRGQGRILALLKMKDGVSTKDMSNVLGIRTSSLNEVLSKLEGKGYIERVQSEEDGRVMVVKLTDKGRAVEQPSFGDGAGGVFDCLTDEEKASFGAYLDRIIAELENELGQLGGEGFETLRREREESFRRFFGRDVPTGDGDGFPPFGGFGGAERCGGRGHFRREDGMDRADRRREERMDRADRRYEDRADRADRRRGGK